MAARDQRCLPRGPAADHIEKADVSLSNYLVFRGAARP